MAHTDAPLESGQGGRCGGGGVAMYQNAIGLHALQHGVNPCEQARKQTIEALIGLHDIELVLGAQVKQSHDLSEHFAMLARNAKTGVEVRLSAQCSHQRSHLDGFGPGTENRNNAHSRSQLVRSTSTAPSQGTPSGKTPSINVSRALRCGCLGGNALRRLTLDAPMIAIVLD